MPGYEDEDARVFAAASDWAGWLEANHATETEIWLLHPKKASTKQGIRYAEAVEEALAWGWIDSKMHRVDEDYFAQRYTPRRPGSVWSRNNRDRVERLIAEGRMTPAGMALVQEAQRRGTWDAAWTDREPSK